MNRLTTVQHHDINVNNRIYFNSPYNSVRPFISSNDNGIVFFPGIRIGEDGSLGIFKTNDILEFHSGVTANRMAYSFPDQQLLVRHFGPNISSPQIDLSSSKVVNINNVLSIDGSRITKNSNILSNDAIATGLVSVPSTSISSFTSTDLALPSGDSTKTSNSCTSSFITKDLNLCSILSTETSSQSSQIGASMIKIEQSTFTKGVTAMVEGTYDPHVYCTITSNTGQLTHIPTNGANVDKFLIKPNTLEYLMDDKYPICRNTWPLLDSKSIMCHGISLDNLTLYTPVFNSGITLGSPGAEVFHPETSAVVDVSALLVNKTLGAYSPDIIAITNTTLDSSTPAASFVGILNKKNTTIPITDANNPNSLVIDHKYCISLINKPTFIGNPVSVITNGVCLIVVSAFDSTTTIEIGKYIFINSSSKLVCNTLSSTNFTNKIGKVMAINDKFITCDLQKI